MHMKIRITTARSHGPSGRPVWFIAGDDDTDRVATVPWYVGDSISDALWRLAHLGTITEDAQVAETVNTEPAYEWQIDGYARWWIIEDNDGEEKSVDVDVYRTVPVPTELVGEARYPHTLSTAWWRRGVNDAMTRTQEWLDVGHDLFVDQIETYRSLRRSGISLDAVCDMTWSDVKELEGVGVRRAARLCWIYEKHGHVPMWKDDMLRRAEYFKEYERSRRSM